MDFVRRKVRLLLAASFFCAMPSLADQTVTIGPTLSFNPSTVMVAPGETVTWVWAAGPHSTTSDATAGPETWDSGVRSGGAAFSHLFTTPGSYPYYCSVHSFPGGASMNGVVLVVLPPSPTPTAVAAPTATATPLPAATPSVTPIPPATPSVTTAPPGATAVPDLGFSARAILVVAFAAAGVLLLFGNLPR